MNTGLPGEHFNGEIGDLSLDAFLRRTRRTLIASIAGMLGFGVPVAATSAAVAVHVQRKPLVRQNVHITFHAKQLPNLGYYYGVIVLKPYRGYTRAKPPPCATSSNMLRTDYGYPDAAGEIALTLTPAKSRTEHWCRRSYYEGAIYAVPHAPPCNSSYPCQSEPYKQPCAGVGPGCITGVVPFYKEWEYPESLPPLRATDTKLLAHFAVRFAR